MKKYIELDKVGCELESSKIDCRKLEDNHPNICDRIGGYENSTIYETTTIAQPIAQVKETVIMFAAIAGITGFGYVDGSDDEYAGSMHTHISFTGEKEVNEQLEHIIKSLHWSNALCFALFSKTGNTFRNAVRGGYTDRGRLKRPEFYATETSSKTYAITYNGTSGGVEWRINENNLPLWVYLVPVLCVNDDKFITLGEEMVNSFISDNSRFTTDSNTISRINTEAVDVLLGLREEVLDYWKSRCDDFEYLEQVLNIYFDANFIPIVTHRKLLNANLIPQN